MLDQPYYLPITRGKNGFICLSYFSKSFTLSIKKNTIIRKKTVQMNFIFYSIDSISNSQETKERS